LPCRFAEFTSKSQLGNLLGDLRQSDLAVCRGCASGSLAGQPKRYGDTEIGIAPATAAQ
jgi:hypothetical protein